MPGNVDQFLSDSGQLVGQEATDVPQGVDLADWLKIRRFCAALGDINPLYKDPAWGASSKYNSMIAPPTYVAAIRTPTSGAAYEQKDYGLVKLLTAVTFEWVDIVRLGDRLTSELGIVEVREGQPFDDGRRVAEVVSQATYRNSYGGPIGTGLGTVAMIPYHRGEELLVDRDIYRYSDEEIARIQRDIESEIPRRGNLLRYWDDAAVGEKLPTLVKGPVTMAEMRGWVVAEAKPLRLGPAMYRELKSKPGRVRVNPTTNWPYSDAKTEHEDILSCTDRGFKAPFTTGMLRACLAGQVLTDWMGDDGFLRRLHVDLPNHYLYGDTMWLTAEVTGKRTEQMDGAIYHAVDVRIHGANQLGETVVQGSATACLPEPGHPVELPIHLLKRGPKAASKVST